MNKKRFLLFVYYHYYPQGGMGDLYGLYSDINEAIRDAEVSIENSCGEFWEIFDTDYGRVMRSEELKWENIST